MTMASSSTVYQSPQESFLLLLDSDIRDWVVLPLFVIMVAAGLLRHYVSVLLKSSPKPYPYLAQRMQHILKHSSASVKGGAANFVSSPKWAARRAYYATQLLREQADFAEEHKDDYKIESASSPTGMPSGAMDGMMGNMAFMVQNMVMMQGIQYFFSGYILLKIPFPLTVGFKMMFQRGLDSLKELDTSYVSSVSWYFLVMFGLRGFFRLVIGQSNTQELQEQPVLLHSLGLFIGPPQPPQDPPKLLRQEADNLELLTTHNSSLDTVEKRLLGKAYPRRKIKQSTPF